MRGRERRGRSEDLLLDQLFRRGQEVGQQLLVHELRHPPPIHTRFIQTALLPSSDHYKKNVAQQIQCCIASFNTNSARVMTINCVRDLPSPETDTCFVDNFNKLA